MPIITCLHCGKEVEAKRVTKKYCSELCASRARSDFPKERTCVECGKIFKVETRGDAARRTCSQSCAKRRNSKRSKKWMDDHPGAMKKYNRNRTDKNPSAWNESNANIRVEILNLLGGKCIVCDVTNRFWLHIDYVPTTRGKPHRHPRHLKYIREHVGDFRLLCANHHYELTLTGKIEGTDITQ